MMLNARRAREARFREQELRRRPNYSGKLHLRAVVSL